MVNLCEFELYCEWGTSESPFIYSRDMDAEFSINFSQKTVSLFFLD